MGLVVGAYERISDDKEEARGVARQAADNEALAKLRGWKIAGHYQDNDVSAFKESVTRPAFERLLADLESGVLGGVVVYNQDRFVRQPSDLERAIKVYDRARAAGRQLVFATVSGDLDLGSDDGITMARVMVAFANKASRDTARRVARKHLEFAQEGRPISAWRPFGWKEDRRTLEPREAEAIRNAVKKLLASVPLAEICRQWNLAGILTPRGNAWVSTRLGRSSVIHAWWGGGSTAKRSSETLRVSRSWASGNRSSRCRSGRPSKQNWTRRSGPRASPGRKARRCLGNTS
jgi:site-specific DNA recombinase